jgi:chlorobactene glucosyltransferase
MSEALSILQLVLLAGAFAHAWFDLLSAPKLPTQTPTRGRWPRLSVVVPARDEEENITACLTSLEAQNYPDLEILVVDDGSTDRTAELVLESAARDGRVRLLRCGERPPDWQGKSWALDRGAREANGAWLAMIDADVTLSPDALRRAVALAESRDVALLSLLPAMRDVTFWERVIQPVMGLFVFLCQPLRRARCPDSAVVVANGQFLLIERGAYDRAGGHRAVKGAIVEDVELARVFKRLRLPVLLAPAFHDVEVRMYRNLGGIWRGWGKTVHPYLAARPLGFWIGIAALLGVFLLPFVLLPIGLAQAPGSAFAIAQLLGVGCILGNAMLFRRAMRHELLHGLLWPLAVAVLVALFAARTIGIVRGAGVAWKGRTYT